MAKFQRLRGKHESLLEASSKIRNSLLYPNKPSFPVTRFRSERRRARFEGSVKDGSPAGEEVDDELVAGGGGAAGAASAHSRMERLGILVRYLTGKRSFIRQFFHRLILRLFLYVSLYYFGFLALQDLVAVGTSHAVDGSAKVVLFGHEAVPEIEEKK